MIHCPIVMGKERKIMKIEVLRKKPLWELKVMVKALSQPVSSFLNTDEDNKRLENCKKIIKERQFLKAIISKGQELGKI